MPPQADPSTLKNLNFALGFYYFLINRRFLYKDALQRLSGLSWAHFWSSWGALGGTFGGLGAFRWLPEILKLLFLQPGSPKLPAEELSTAPNSAPGALIVKQKAPRSHQGRHFGTDAFRCLTISEQHPPQKDSRGHRQGISEATLGLSNSMFVLSSLLLMFCFCFFSCFSFFSSGLSVSFTINMRLRPRRGLRLELKLKLKMGLGLGL